MEAERLHDSLPSRKCALQRACLAMWRSIFAAEYRHRDSKVRRTIERTKQFLLDLSSLPTRAWTPARKHEALAAKLGSLDREKGELAHIERSHIPKFDRYVASVRAWQHGRQRCRA